MSLKHNNVVFKTCMIWIIKSKNNFQKQNLDGIHNVELNEFENIRQYLNLPCLGFKKKTFSK